jgi:putative membrane protein
MLWIKAFHIIFVVSWFAGLFYLPRLFVYHAMTTDAAGNERFKVMERKLYYGIMAPAALLSIASGLWLWIAYDFDGRWLDFKLVLVAVLVVYHFYCGELMMAFKQDRNRHGHVFFRWLNEMPTVILIVAVILVVLKPF